MTTTPNKGYTQPTVGADFNTWGGELNGDFDIIDKNLGGIAQPVVVGTAVTLTDADAQNNMIVVLGTASGPATATFPASARGTYVVSNSCGMLLTLTNGGVDSLTLAVGDRVQVVVAASGVYLVGVSTTAANFQLNVNNPGYLNLLGGGLPFTTMIQTGSAMITAPGVTVTFAEAFPHVCLALTLGGNNSTAIFYTWQGKSTTGFFAQAWDPAGGAAGGSFDYIAIGY